jgi:transcriptional regulator with XRE-family HTH domain
MSGGQVCTLCCLIYKRLMDEGLDTREAMLRAIGERIRELREAKNLAPKEFAAAAGFSMAYLWRVEGGQQNLRVTTVSKIAIALNVPMAAIFENIEPDPSSVGPGPYSYRQKHGGG